MVVLVIFVFMKSNMKSILSQFIRSVVIIACFLTIETGIAAQGTVSDGKFVDAVAKYNAKDYNGAIDLLRGIGKTDPDNDGAQYYLGLSYMMTGNVVEAETALKKAISIDSTNFWYRYRLAQLYSMTERYELTISMYEELLKDFPKKSDLYFELVSLYMNDKNTEKALATLDEIESMMGKSENCALAKFDILSREGKEEEALKVLTDYNSEFSSPKILSLLASYELQQYNYSAALDYYNEALTIDKDYAPVRFGKAEVYRMASQYSEYFQELQETMGNSSIDPESKATYLYAILNHLDAKFINNFRSRLDSTFDVTMKCHPTDSSILHISSSYYDNTGRNDRAKEIATYNIGQNPDNKNVFAQYIEVMLHGGDFDAASKGCDTAYTRFQDPAFLLILNRILSVKQDYAGVIANSRRILSETPEAQADSSIALECYTLIGDSYHALGDSKNAFKNYETALKIKPDFTPVLNNYAYYLSLEKKSLKKAYEMSKKTIDAEPDNPTYLDTFGWILHLMGRDQEAKPIFKHAMLYGGKESSTILEHYAEVLEKLGEKDLAIVYKNRAKAKKAEEAAAENTGTN